MRVGEIPQSSREKKKPGGYSGLFQGREKTGRWLLTCRRGDVFGSDNDVFIGADFVGK